MKNSKEYKISTVLFICALVCYAISIVTGLIPNYDYNTDKIFMYLGFAFNGFGLTYLKKSENSNDNKDDKKEDKKNK